MFLASIHFFDFSFFYSIAFDFLIATDANRKSCLVNCLLRLVGNIRLLPDIFHEYDFLMGD